MKKVEVVINGYRYDLPDGFAFNLKHIVDFYCEGSGNGKFLGKVVDESGFVAVPESLDIVNSINRKTLGIVFNNNNNVLWFAHNLWSVTENNDLWESCKM